VPGMSMSVERAARRIVRACIRGEAEVVLSLQAKSAAGFHGVFPGLTSDILGVVDKMLPPPGGIGEGSRAGHESFSKISPSWVTALSERAAVRNNEVS